MQQYRLEHKEQIEERTRQYHSEHKEQIKERTRQYRLKNKEKIKKRRHQYYLEQKHKKATETLAVSALIALQHTTQSTQENVT
jgi:5,10-methylene-tetrahydrofolate dehydrogenase/methenyl tetrahydrofolate cyclohydrolase